MSACSIQLSRTKLLTKYCLSRLITTANICTGPCCLTKHPAPPEGRAVMCMAPREDAGGVGASLLVPLKASGPHPALTPVQYAGLASAPAMHLGCRWFIFPDSPALSLSPTSAPGTTQPGTGPALRTGPPLCTQPVPSPCPPGPTLPAVSPANSPTFPKVWTVAVAGFRAQAWPCERAVT